MRMTHLIYSLALFFFIRYNRGVYFSGYFLLMRINLDVLLILDALDKQGSFAAAAESLFKPCGTQLYDSEAGKRFEY